MTYTQFSTSDELEAHLQKTKSGFVSEDNRVYTKIQLSDDAVYMEFDAKTALALYNLQSYIEMALDSGNEMGFTNVVEQAKELEKAFKEACKQIKFKPVIRKIR